VLAFFIAVDTRRDKQTIVSMLRMSAALGRDTKRIIYSSVNHTTQRIFIMRSMCFKAVNEHLDFER
jgi:hypothetical protein